MHRTRQYVVASIAVAAVVLFTSSCSSSRHAPEEKYVLVATNIKVPYWQEAAKGLEAASSKMGIRADFVGPETNNPKEQLEAFKKAVAGKPTGIMISASDSQLMNDAINSAVAAGIPVITMDSDAPGSHRLFFVGTNNYQAGFMGGKTLVQKLGRKGNVVVFTIPAQANLIDRLKGYEDAIAGTDIKIVETVDDRGDSNVTFDKTTEFIEKSKLKIDAFVCLDSTSGAMVAEVLDRKKEKKIVIAMDTDDDTLKWVEKGAIAATIGQKPYTMAYYGLHLLDGLHHSPPKPLDGDWGKVLESPVPSAVDTGSSLIDQSNVSSIRKAAK